MGEVGQKTGNSLLWPYTEGKRVGEKERERERGGGRFLSWSLLVLWKEAGTT